MQAPLLGEFAAQTAVLLRQLSLVLVRRLRHPLGQCLRALQARRRAVRAVPLHTGLHNRDLATNAKAKYPFRMCVRFITGMNSVESDTCTKSWLYLQSYVSFVGLMCRAGCRVTIPIDSQVVAALYMLWSFIHRLLLLSIPVGQRQESCYP